MTCALACSQAEFTEVNDTNRVSTRELRLLKALWLVDVLMALRWATALQQLLLLQLYISSLVFAGIPCSNPVDFRQQRGGPFENNCLFELRVGGRGLGHLVPKGHNLVRQDGKGLLVGESADLSAEKLVLKLICTISVS